MKKYKHKITGDTVILEDDQYSAHLAFLRDQLIPRRFIIGSNDWQEIVESKNPLFTTEDGVEIFEGTRMHCINLDLYRYYDETIAANIHMNQSIDKSHGIVWFSTKEAAKNYIIENKPCLSYIDILNLCKKRDNFETNIKQLIKSKLNL